jgi:hypothetical protein
VDEEGPTSEQLSDIVAAASSVLAARGGKVSQGHESHLSQDFTIPGSTWRQGQAEGHGSRQLEDFTLYIHGLNLEPCCRTTACVPGSPAAVLLCPPIGSSCSACVLCCTGPFGAIQYHLLVLRLAVVLSQCSIS